MFHFFTLKRVVLSLVTHGHATSVWSNCLLHIIWVYSKMKYLKLSSLLTRGDNFQVIRARQWSWSYYNRTSIYVYRNCLELFYHTYSNPYMMSIEPTEQLLSPSQIHHCDHTKRNSYYPLVLCSIAKEKKQPRFNHNMEQGLILNQPSSPLFKCSILVLIPRRHKKCNDGTCEGDSHSHSHTGESIRGDVMLSCSISAVDRSTIAKFIRHGVHAWNSCDNRNDQVQWQ